MRDKFIMIYVTAPSRAQARRIILRLLRKRLAACGGILGGVESLFLWKGRIDKAREVLVLLKTRRGLFATAAREIKKIHSYEVPEIIAAPVIAGDKEYLKWMDGVVEKD